jgi:hypothetical protein
LDGSRAVPAELQLDGEEAFEQLPRLQFRFESDYGIYKSGLGGESDWLGAEERGAGQKVAKGFEASGRCG